MKAAAPAPKAELAPSAPYALTRDLTEFAIRLVEENAEAAAKAKAPPSRPGVNATPPEPEKPSRPLAAAAATVERPAAKPARPVETIAAAAPLKSQLQQKRQSQPRPRPQQQAQPDPVIQPAIQTQPQARAQTRIQTQLRTPPQRKQPAKAARPSMKAAPLPRTRLSPSIAPKPLAKTAIKAAKSPILQQRLPLTAKTAVKTAASPKKMAASAARSRRPKHPPFRKVLAYSIQQPKRPPTRKKDLAPDRSRRITTRFSRAEERRIEKFAAEAGLSVSAYLRECALSAAAKQKAQALPALTATGGKKASRAAAQALFSQSYSAPPPSLLGGWLALLRNRFLGPPIRYTADA